MYHILFVTQKLDWIKIEKKFYYLYNLHFLSMHLDYEARFTKIGNLVVNKLLEASFFASSSSFETF